LFRISVDVGGTFTDAVMVDDSRGILYFLKIRSTPSQPDEGFGAALSGILSGRADPQEVGTVVHAGTIGSNLLLGQLGIRVPKCALITTEGFRDVIEIGRQNRSELYSINFTRPVPLIPRNLRYEAKERVDSDGRVLSRPGVNELRGLAKLMEASHVETVAISFLNSYANPSNEMFVEKFLAGTLRVPVHASSRVDPEHREYERTSTTVVNAVLSPVISAYVESASERMRRLGLASLLQIFGSAGGLLDVGEVRRRPVLAVESGPAAGVVGAAELARLMGLRKIISLDMGGTTAKAGAVINFEPLLISEIELGGRVNKGRLVKSSGYPVRTRSIDLAEVSAGGGTIISVGEAGVINVGPLSAGADPGPASYGRGGKAPTITDANLLMGRIGTEILGGELKLDANLAFEAFEPLAKRARMEVHELADATLRIVNLQMAKAVEIVSLERGLDPRGFALVAFGGAGPMHAAELAEHLGITKIIVPPVPGLFSALGMLMTDMKYSRVRGMVRLLQDVDEEELDDSYREMEREGEESLQGSGIASRPRFKRGIDLRYYGEGYELELDLHGRLGREVLSEAFERKHVEVYGFAHKGQEVELTALRSTMIVTVPKVSLEEMRRAEFPKAEKRGRRVWFDGGWLQTRVKDRASLDLGDKIEGPAILEEYDSTVVIPPGWRCKSHVLGCLILEKKRE